MSVSERKKLIRGFESMTESDKVIDSARIKRDREKLLKELGGRVV